VSDFLEALDDVRAEREGLYRHDTEPPRADGPLPSVRVGEPSTRLDEVTIERGRAHVARLREQIEANRARRPGGAR